MPNTYNLPTDATLAPRTDGSTVKFVVTAVQEIDVYEDLELYEVPAGDFMADGSVPMTGSIVFEEGSIVTPLKAANPVEGGMISISDQQAGALFQVYNGYDALFDATQASFSIFTDSISVGYAHINEVPDPINPDHAANKSYVDTEIAAIPPGGTGDFMADGSVPMTNDIIVPSGTVITSVLDQYTAIDCDGASWVFKINGGQPLRVTKTLTTLSTELHLNNNKIINLLDPVDPQDAATKAYVDTGDGVLLAKIDTLETQLTKAIDLITALQTKVDAL